MSEAIKLLERNGNVIDRKLVKQVREKGGGAGEGHKEPSSLF